MIKHRTCAALMASGPPKRYRRDNSSPLRGAPCPWEASETEHGVSLCWVHASVVRLGVATLSEVQNGWREARESQP